jgi:hypothetical protein
MHTISLLKVSVHTYTSLMPAERICTYHYILPIFFFFALLNESINAYNKPPESISTYIHKPDAS